MLLMKDMDMVTEHCDTGSAIEIENATLAWEKPVTEKQDEKLSMLIIVSYHSPLARPTYFLYRDVTWTAKIPLLNFNTQKHRSV